MRRSVKSLCALLALIAVGLTAAGGEPDPYLSWLDREEALISQAVSSCERSGGRDLGPLDDARRLARAPGGISLRYTFWLETMAKRAQGAAAKDRLGRLREIQTLLREHRSLVSTRFAAIDEEEARERLRLILARPEFARQPQVKGWKERIWDRIGPFVGRVLAAFFRSGAAVRALYVLVALAAISIVFFLILALRTRSLARRRTGIDAGGNDAARAMSRQRPDDLMRQADQAYRERRFRDGLRLLYLALLQELDLAGHIHLVMHKTNWEYRREIERSRSGLAAYFTPLTDLYEAKWYGGEACAAEHFLAARRLFDQAREAAR